MLFRKKPETPATPVPAPPAAPTPGRRFTDKVGRAGTRIVRGMTLRGDISGGDSVELAGSLDGDVTIEGLCHVGREGRILGRVQATHVVVEGEIEGDIRAGRKVELRATARVRADLVAHTVAMAEGSHFDGRIHMEPSPGGGEAGLHHSFQEKRKAVPSSED